MELAAMSLPQSLPPARITVVVPCYRQAHFLRECLNSLIAQVMPDWRAIVVDDASPDGAEIRSVVQEVNDPRISLVVHPENRGSSAARNTGIELADTEFVTCLDADDMLDPRHLEVTLGMFAADPTLRGVTIGYRLFGSWSGDRPARLPQLTELLEGCQPPTGAGFVMRKSLWRDAGKYDEGDMLRRGREDIELYIRIFARNEKIAHTPELLYYARTAEVSLNRSCRQYEHEVWNYIYQKHRKLFHTVGRGKRSFSQAYDAASWSAHHRKARWKALNYGVRAAWHDPTRTRIRRVARLILEALHLPGPKRKPAAKTAQPSS